MTGTNLLAQPTAFAGTNLSEFGMVEQTAVETFLNRHLFLLPLLREAPDQIHRHFPGAGLRLELRQDRECEGRATLFLYIESAGNAPLALAGLDALRQDWWFRRARQADRKLAVALDFT